MKIFYAILLLALSLPMKGQLSFGLVLGLTKPINQTSDNSSEIKNFSGNVVLNMDDILNNSRDYGLNIRGYFSQQGISLNYQENKHFFTFELTGNTLGILCDLNYIKSNGQASSNAFISSSRSSPRLNFQYGYGIVSSKKQNFFIIPTIALGVMPYVRSNFYKGGGIINGDTGLRLSKTYNNKGLSTVITAGLSSKIKLNNRLDLQLNATYTHGFAEKFRVTYYKNLYSRGMLYIDIYNKARFYNFNLALNYKIKKEKPEEVFDMMELEEE